MKLRLLAIVIMILGAGFLVNWAVTAQATNGEPGVISPLTGEVELSPGVDGEKSSPAAAAAGTELGFVPGGLYATDGQKLYLINKKTGSPTLVGPHGPVDIAIGALAFNEDGVLYGMSIGDFAKLYRIDPTTGAATAVGPIGFFVFEGGLDFDEEGKLFATNSGTAADAKTFTINLVTGAGTVFGPNPGESRDIDGLAYDGHTFYAIDRVSNTLGIMSPTTGAYTPIGNPGFTIGNQGGLAIDPADGKLYAVFAGTGGFYTLNKSTGSATLISTPNIFYGLAFSPVENLYLPLLIR